MGTDMRIRMRTLTALAGVLGLSLVSGCAQGAPGRRRTR